MEKIKWYLSLLLLLKLFFVDAVIATLFVIEVAPILGIVYMAVTIFMFVACYNTIAKVNKFAKENSDILTKTAIELGMIKQKKVEVDVID